MKKIVRFGLTMAVVSVGLVTHARGDEVTDWNQTLFRTSVMAGSDPLSLTRIAAIVQTAVFDAVNGIDRRYTPVHVKELAPAGTSARAAAVQASYAALVKLYPAQRGSLDARRGVSLALLSSEGRETSDSIAKGIAWGQKVADEILAWRSTDGLTQPLPPFMGGSDPGAWRPTPPFFIPAVGQPFARMTPWVIPSPSQFRPAGPPSLNSNRYAAEFNEVKTAGRLQTLVRTADQTVYSLFWESATGFIWNDVALALADRAARNADEDRPEDCEDDEVCHRPLSIVTKARLLAAVNLAMADAGIACWDAKFTFASWRPVTAIAAAAGDDNPATTEEANWSSLYPAPPFPDYPSGHSCASAAAATVLSGYFGDRTRFTAKSDAMVGVTRKFRSFSEAIREVNDSRVFSGIHFRSSVEDGQAVGVKVGKYVVDNSLQPVGAEADDY